jgi:hypothetical protein
MVAIAGLPPQLFPFHVPTNLLTMTFCTHILRQREEHDVEATARGRGVSGVESAGSGERDDAF